MFKATLKSLLSRKLRLILSGLAVVLSVMFMSAAFVLGDTLGRSFEALFSNVYSYTQLQVAHKTEPNSQGPPQLKPLPASLVEEIKAVPGVSAATGEVFTGDARVIGHNGKVVPNPSGNHFGSSWTGENQLIQLKQGHGPTADNEVVINAALASSGDFVLGEQIGILTPGSPDKQLFTIVGIFDYSGRESLAGEHTVGFTTAAAQKLLLGEEGVFSDVDVKVADGQSISAVQQAIQAKIGADYQVKTGDELAKESSDSFKQLLNVVTYVLIGFASVAVLVGIFLIFNTFNIVVAQRTRELALLRAMGASSGQVLGSVVIEALLVGFVFAVIGWAVGAGLGAGGAYLLTGLFDGLKVASIGFPLVGILVPILLGVLMTVVAALVPALRASGVAPIAALRDAARPDKPLRRLTIAGGAILLVGIVVLSLGLAGVSDQAGWMILGGVVVCFFGVALLTPLLGKPIVGLLGRIFSWSTAGQLGRRNSARNPRRTAVTASALMIGIAIVTGISTVFASVSTTLTDAVNDLVKADLVISGQQTSATPPAVSPTALTKTRALPEVQAVAALSFDAAKIDGKDDFVISYDDQRAATEILNVKPVEGRLTPVESGQFITDDKTAADHNWKVGSTAQIELFKGGPRGYTLVGIYKRETGATGSVISWADEQTGFRIATPIQAYVKLKPGADQKAVAATIDGYLADSPEVSVQTREDYIKGQASLFDAILNVIQVLLLVAMFVAVLGVINTLVLSVVERTRELGMLRAIGLRRGQTAWMITVESMVISVFGALLGIGVGVSLGAAGVRALKDQGINTLTLPWGLMILYLVAAAIVGAVAAIIPAFRAARLNVLEAISYE